MASYFIATHAQPFGEVAVHDRNRCPPDCFLRDGTTEYLGEFLDANQAVAVARLRYAHARGCPQCEAVRARATLPPPLAMPTAPA
jgi:hypothetical protein